MLRKEFNFIKIFKIDFIIYYLLLFYIFFKVGPTKRFCKYICNLISKILINLQEEHDVIFCFLLHHKIGEQSKKNMNLLVDVQSLRFLTLSTFENLESIISSHFRY